MPHNKPPSSFKRSPLTLALSPRGEGIVGAAPLPKGRGNCRGCASLQGEEILEGSALLTSSPLRGEDGGEGASLPKGRGNDCKNWPSSLLPLRPFDSVAQSPISRLVQHNMDMSGILLKILIGRIDG